MSAPMPKRFGYFEADPVLGVASSASYGRRRPSYWWWWSSYGIGRTSFYESWSSPYVVRDLGRGSDMQGWL